MSSALQSLSRLAAPAEPAEGSPITDSRESLRYWSQRASALPWHKRAARREARTRMAAARARLVAAHLERWGLGSLARLLAPLLDTGKRSAAAHGRSLALAAMRRNPLCRRILLGIAGAAAIGFTILVVLVALVTNLLGLWSF